MRGSVRERFEAKVDRRGGPDACHRWKGSIGNSGTPRLWIANRKNAAANRLAWEFHHGVELTPDVEVIRTCATVGCVNVKHLRAERLPSPEERFWTFIDRSAGDDACWPWTAARYRNGAGQFFADGKNHRAHRFAWELLRGPIPAEKFVIHRCGNALCCNPAHLYLGDSLDKSREMEIWGRRARGEKTSPKWIRQLKRRIAEVQAELDAEAARAMSEPPPPPLPPGSSLGVVYRPADESVVARYADTFQVDPKKVERGNRGHRETQNALASFLRSRGLEPRSPGPDDPDFDVAWSFNGSIYVAEVKSITAENEPRQMRLGVGQVLYYRVFLSRRTSVPIRAVLVAERRPEDELWSALAQEQGFVLVWPEAFPALLVPEDTASGSD